MEGLFFFFTHRKLAAFDVGSQLAIHVAMDMLVVVDDLSKSPLNLWNQLNFDWFKSAASLYLTWDIHELFITRN